MSALTVPRPEPVTMAGRVAGVLSSLATLAVSVGWLTATDADTLVTAAVAVVGAVATLVSLAAPILKARSARDKVTPIDAPAVTLPNGRTVDAELVPVIDARGSGAGGQFPAG